MNPLEIDVVCLLCQAGPFAPEACLSARWRNRKSCGCYLWSCCFQVSSRDVGRRLLLRVHQGGGGWGVVKGLGEGIVVAWKWS